MKRKTINWIFGICHCESVNVGAMFPGLSLGEMVLSMFTPAHIIKPALKCEYVT